MAEPDWTEAERLAALHGYAILDTPPEPAFDDAVALVKTICRVPIALVSLVDAERQWFKAKVGVDAAETALDTSVCALAIRQSDVFVIEDLSRDPRTAAMSLVIGDPNIRFYAGAPLITSNGLPVGSLCAIDLEPRPGGLDPEQTRALVALGRQIVAQIELRGAIDSRDRALADQERRQAQATREAGVLRAMLAAQQRVLESGGAFDTALQTLVDAAMEAVQPADGVVVEICEGRATIIRAASGTSRDRTGLHIPLATSFSGWAVREQSALISADATLDDRGDRAAAVAAGIRSLLIVPLARRGGIFGVLKLHAAKPDMFRSRHVLVAQMLAGLVAASFTEGAEMAALQSASESEKSYRHIVDSAIDSAIISTDADGIVTSWSRGGETMFGWSEAEMLGRPLDTIFTAEDVAAGRAGAELAKAEAEGRASDERWHRRKDGSLFYAHGAVTPLLGPGKGFVKSLRDVTGEHATREALERSRLRLDAALETGLIGFFTWNVPDDIVTGDARYAEFHGLDRAAVEAGMSSAESARNILPADQPAMLRQILGSLKTGADYSANFRLLRADGGIRWMLLRGRCIERRGDRSILYVGTAIDISSQREAEERLRISRERLELATRAARLGSFDFMPQTGALDWDDRCRALFGVSPGAPVTYEGTFLAGLHPDDRAMADAAVAAALDPDGTGTFDLDYRTIGLEDGVERVISAHGLAMFADRLPVRLIGTVQDVTADHRAVALLRETEERLRLAVHATNDAIWDWDLRRDHVRWNDALERAYGHPPDSVEPTGAWWLDHIHPDDRARVDRSIHAVIDGSDSDWTAEYRFRRADGSHADVRDRGYVIRDEAGRAIRMLGALLDQTDRKTIERELQQLNQSLEISVSERTAELDRLWETSPDLLLVIDFEGIIHRVNPAWTTILGYPPEELLGRQLIRFLLPEDLPEAARSLAAVKGGTVPNIETRLRHKDGSVRWFAWVAAPASGLIYATGRHVTADKEAAEALRRAEDQLRQAQKVEAIGQLTGGVAHDFNNLLTVIRGSVDLLRRPNITEARRTRYIDAIADTADRATKLTSQLLAFARRSALKPETFDAGASILALRDMMGTLTGSLIRLTIEVCDTLCLIDADPSQFDTAIVNMAVNARDAMDRQGDLRISVRAVDTIPPLRAHARVAGDFVAIAITDTGVGIAPDRIEHIFEPFFTTKRVGEGTGLGLSQVFGFAKQSGGEVQVESRPGEGATFTLYLPRAAATGLRADAAAAEPAAEGRGACVLVVEDNPEVGDFATQALAELGYDTVLAADAEHALALLAEGHSRFDVVFSDVIMPGITGIELAMEIRRLYPALPVVLTSGYSNVLAQDGAQGFALLHKPYSLEELSRALRRILATDAG